MSRAFAQIAFTPDVQAVQARMGSRDAYQQVWPESAEEVLLSSYEIEFIGARDSFYQATVGSGGWPYVQHRGGPPGFLKVLGPTTIGYADYSGNRQYISVGNLAGDDRVSLILMDYPAQRRLKIWGRARVVGPDEAPDLLARLESPDYRARVERGVIIEVQAFDWNCPKHITPRFDEREWRLRAQELSPPQSRPTTTPVADGRIGDGELDLVVAGIRQLTPRIRAFELRGFGDAELPAAPAGAHLEVPVRLPDGSVVKRQYSLIVDRRRRHAYEIAVLNEDAGRGGSAAIHGTWELGTRLAVAAPSQHFPLHDDDRPAVLFAGGVGITAIRSMALELRARGNGFELHCSARTPAEMAYREELAGEFPGLLHLYFTRAPIPSRCDIRSVLRSAPPDALFYVCGPRQMIQAVSDAAIELGVSTARVQSESFE